MMIDVTKFLIISQDQFEQIIAMFRCNLTIADHNYLITYIFINFFAYFLIIMTIVISLKIYRKLRRKVFSAKFIQL